MLRTVSIALFSLLAVAPVSAQDDATPPEPTASERFDLAAALSEGTTPLTAPRAAALAMERSPRVTVAELAVRAARAGVDRATAALVPRLDLTARYAHVDGFPDGQIGTAPDPAAIEAARMLAGRVTDPAAQALFGGLIDQQAAAGGVSIRIPRDQIGFIGRITIPASDILLALLPALEGSEARVRAEELRVQVAQHDVAFSAEEAFYRYVEARGALAVAEQARVTAAEQRAQIERYVQAGLLTRADLATADARVAQIDEAIARGRAGVALAGAALSILTGGPSSADYAIDASVLSTELDVASLDSDALEARAVEQRPELRALREAIVAQSRARDATLAGGYPHLSLYLAGDISNPSQRMIPPRQEFQPSYEIGAVLTWSPNDLATSMLAGDDLAAQIARAEEEGELLADAVRLEVRQSVETARAATGALAAAHAATLAAEEAYRAREAQLAAGEAVTTEVAAADARVIEARLAELRATIELRVAEARLRHATGVE